MKIKGGRSPVHAFEFQSCLSRSDEREDIPYRAVVYVTHRARIWPLPAKRVYTFFSYSRKEEKQSRERKKKEKGSRLSPTKSKRNEERKREKERKEKKCKTKKAGKVPRDCIDF